MNNTWFSSDSHFGHEAIIRHSKRPFKSVAHMDETLIANWNQRVRPNDEVWHLGDFNFRSEHQTPFYRLRLNGRIHIVFGNHDDKYARKFPKLFSTTQDVKYLHLNGEKITLYHYAQRVWRNSHHGAWHLYGHSHGCLPNFHRSMDVGADAQEYAPVHFDTIKAYMDTQEVTDHHPEIIADAWVRE